MQWSEKLRVSKKWCKTWQIEICPLARCYRWNYKAQTTGLCRVQSTQDLCTIQTSLAMLVASKEEQKNRLAVILNCPNKISKSRAPLELIAQRSQSGKWLLITQLWWRLVPNQEKIGTYTHRLGTTSRKWTTSALAQPYPLPIIQVLLFWTSLQILMIRA